MTKPTNRARIAIVGAGIAAATLAVEAHDRGADITVFERDHIAAGASGRAVGALHPFTGMRLSRRTEHLLGFKLTRALLSRLDSTISDEPGILRLVTKERQAELWQRRARELHSRNDLEWRDEQHIQRMLNERGTDRIVGGVWIPRGTFVRVPEFIAGCFKLADARTVIGSTVTSVDETSDTVTVTTDDGNQRRFDAVVVAAGLGTSKLLPDVDVPFAPYKGEIGMFTGLPAPEVTLNHRGYIMDVGRGRTLVGVLDSHPPFTGDLRPDIGQALLDRAAEIWAPAGNANATLVAAWSGIRPATTSREPYIGPAPGHQRTWALTGYGGRGLLVGTLAAAAVAADILGGAKPATPDSWWTTSRANHRPA